jgi:hypothetical protein
METTKVGSGGPVVDGRAFWSGGSGRWAGEQMLRALQQGRELSASVLRTADTLRLREWIEFDQALVKSALIRLRGIADLRAAGLTRPVRGGLGKTFFQYEKSSFLQPAQLTMDGIARTEGDRQEFELNSLPLPILHKDFYINLRTLTASRAMSEPLDTMQIETAGRVIAEKLEDMLFNGGPQFGGTPIYGYATHPDANTATFGSNGAWDQAAKTGENILTDVLSMITELEQDRMYGPYALYVPSGYSVKLEGDFKANGDKTIRDRLLSVDRLQSVTVADQMPAAKVIMVQMTSDTVVLVDGEPLQTIQWDIEGGFQVNFKGFQICVPLIRSDKDKHCGVCVLSA